MTGFALAGIQLALGLIFLQSSLGKLRRPTEFLRGVAAYQVLPSFLAAPFGALVIPLELLIAVSFLTGQWSGMATYIGLLLLTSFLIAVAINIRRRRTLPCYCFGAASEEQISTRSLVRIVLLEAGMLTIVLYPTFSMSLSCWPWMMSPQHGRGWPRFLGETRHQPWPAA